ncbi:hypothetical protein WI372_10890 [Gemmatimonadota bacterium DH-20]|uniref:Uncharacterized protein n=1 Tax=Gaopeijia maritima TaxID=3119007 RepID=A0ABU9EBI5_9BACT
MSPRSCPPAPRPSGTRAPPAPPLPARGRVRGGAPWIAIGLLLLVAGAVAFALAFRYASRAQTPEERAFARERADFAPDSIAALGRIDAALRESSGLAVASDGMHLWSHNDSGDEARFYALDRTGARVATFELEGVEAQDWESMDAGPCALDPSRRCLYLADTGDNARRRDVLTVHLVPEPDEPRLDARVAALGRLRFLYPARARDAEAVAVSPAGDFVVISKGRTGDIVLFHLEPEALRSAIESDAPVRFERGRGLGLVPDWPVGRVVTGAAFRPDGAVLAVRTLSEIHFFDWPALTEAAPACFLGTLEPQGEAVTWDSDGALLLSSETSWKGPGMLTRVRCAGV